MLSPQGNHSQHNSEMSPLQNTVFSLSTALDEASPYFVSIIVQGELQSESRYVFVDIITRRRSRSGTTVSLLFNDDQEDHLLLPLRCTSYQYLVEKGEVPGQCFANPLKDLYLGCVRLWFAWVELAYRKSLSEHDETALTIGRIVRQHRCPLELVQTSTKGRLEARRVIPADT